MVVFSTKFNRKRAVAAVVALAVVLVLIVLLAGRRDMGSAKATGAIVKDNGERVEYLSELGWEVEPNAIEEQTVLIPEQFTDVYERYNEIQTAQGFDLSKYAGVEAQRYTYRITRIGIQIK